MSRRCGRSRKFPGALDAFGARRWIRRDWVVIATALGCIFSRAVSREDLAGDSADVEPDQLAVRANALVTVDTRERRIMWALRSAAQRRQIAS